MGIGRQDATTSRSFGFWRPSISRCFMVPLKDALRLSAIGYDAVKHLVLCRIERRPPKLRHWISYPYLTRADVATTAAASYMTLYGSRRVMTDTPQVLLAHQLTTLKAADVPARIRQAGPPMHHRGRRLCAVSCPSDRVGI